MLDQAKRLRQLVRAAHAAGPPPGGAPPRLVVVAGGKGGVGTTTVAVNLAVTLAGEGIRAVLADMSATGTGVAMLCHVVERHTVGDVLAGTRSIVETLQPGPRGIQILAGVCGSDELWECPPSAHDRLVEQLRGLGDWADVVVVDSGNSPSRIARRMWQAANPVLLVTTTDLESILDAYAAVKAIAAGDDLLPLWTLVNKAADTATSAGVHERMAAACRRFLGVPCRAAGQIDDSVQVRQSRNKHEPFVLAAPRSAAAGQVVQLARLVANEPRRERMTQDAGPAGRFVEAQ
jgi:flagellar biosynthesis protein FlhG